MDLFLAICQGAGLALAIGIGNPIAAPFVATMAHVGLGIDPEGTDLELLSSSGFVALLFVLGLGLLLLRNHSAARLPLLAFAALSGALAFGASLAEEGSSIVPGILAGAFLAVGAAMLSGAVLGGAERRARTGGDGGPGGLVAIFALVGVAAALMALFVPPTAIAVAVALLVLAAGRRRRAAQKYEGLRILR
jgi:hypothetical protein